ncbi:MAG: ribosome recycling factor [Chloroflexi bacterium]|nr:ribosome recycling factor [Chloroflexota bacterium]
MSAKQADEILSSAEVKMLKAIEALEHDLASIRTGRASPTLVEHLKVDYFGTPTPLNQLAGISAPESRLLVIQPWDRGTLKAIEKSILQSELGLNPASDGVVIRLPIPALTEERRRELVKLVHRRVEEGRVAIRNVRRDAHEHLRRLQKGGELAEDDERRYQERLQKTTDESIAAAEEGGAAKEKELLEV